MRFIAFVVLCATAAIPAPAAGQSSEPQTRAELLRREREEKQKTAKPYEQSGLERAMDFGENRVVPLLQRDGIYAKLGSLTTGSGFAYGAGFRDRSLVRGRGSLDLWGAASLKKYWALDARVRYPIAAGDRLTVEGHARRFEYPLEEYFGPGPDSARPDRTAYTVRGSLAGGQLAYQATRPLSFAGGVEYLRPTIANATSDDIPSIERLFDAATAPGLAASHEFVRSSAGITYDYRQPLNARRGGFYQFDLNRFDDQHGGAFSFNRFDLDLRQYVSFLAERRVFAFRARLSTTDADAGSQVPFFLLPSLGGNDTLRGFRAHRFRGPHAMLLQAEYRWEIWSALEGAIFYDAGKVTGRRGDLNLRDLEHDYGFGFRFNTDDGVVMRVDAAFGSRDGRHLHIVFGGIF